MNSFRFHSTPSDRSADDIRYRSLVCAGFTVAVVWEDDLWSRPYNVVDTIVEARRRARAGAHDVVHSSGCPWPRDGCRIVIDTLIPPPRWMNDTFRAVGPSLR